MRQALLFLCTAFVLYLLRLDQKQSRDVSKAFWIPSIWMLAVSIKPLAYWFGSSSTDDLSGSPLDRNFQLALIAAASWVLFSRSHLLKNALRGQTILILLLTYMFVSILWSDIPFVSFKRWVREVGAVLMALIVLTEKNPRAAMESIFRRIAYILIPFSLLFVKYFPEYGVVYGRWSGELMWVGVTLQKNGLGQLCLLSAFYLMWHLAVRAIRKRDMEIKYVTHAEVVVLGITLWLLKGPAHKAASATSIAVLCIGLGMFFGLHWLNRMRRRLQPQTFVAVTACLLIFGIATPLVGGATVGTFTSALGRDATLTGRTDIWASLLPDFMKSPFLGYGFGAFWTPATEEKHEITAAHNGYLEICLGTGFVGLALMSCFLLSFCKRAARAQAYDYDWGSFCLSFLMVTVLHNISEASFDSFTRQLTAFVLFLMMSVSATRRLSPAPSRQVSKDMSRVVTKQPLGAGA